MKTHLLIPSCLLVALSSAQAATIITNFNTQLDNTGATGASRPAFYSGGINFTNASSTWAQNIATVTAPFTFTYDISGLGIGSAAELLITVNTISSTAALVPAAGNGIAVNGGDNNNWWDPNDPSLSFSVVVEDASNNDITSTLSIDLTGIGMRWGENATATFAGQSISAVGTAAANLEGVNLATGGTADTSFTGTRTGTVGLTQLQQLRFEIIPEPSAALLSALGMLALLRRRR